MASISMNDNPFSPEYIEELQKRLLEHPIDPAYDEICNSFYDGLAPDVLNQMGSRMIYDLLKSLGKLPEGIE